MVDTAVSDAYFSTIEEADALVLKRPNSTAWTGTGKAAALQEATRRIDALPLRGYRYERAYLYNGTQKDVDDDGLIQTLEFPRIIDGVVCDYDYATQLPVIPALVKWACLEEAISILEFNADIDRTERQTMKADGVKSYSLGGDYSETLGPASIDVQGGLRSPVAWRNMRRYVGVEVR
jgi:hypothetical protein